MVMAFCQHLLPSPIAYELTVASMIDHSSQLQALPTKGLTAEQDGPLR